MTIPGKNKSIWFDNDRLVKLDKIVASMQDRTGLRISDSAVIMRAIDVLFLSECPTDKPNVVSVDQPAEPVVN